MSINDDPCCCPNSWGLTEESFRIGVLTLLCRQIQEGGTETAMSDGAYGNSLIVKDSPGTLYRVFGYNSGPAQFIQVHNTVAVPANGVAPVTFFAVPAASNFDFNLGPLGLDLSTGIVLTNSTTGPTLTIGAANVWFNARYT